ncbi:MAG: DUF99 family protein [Nitrososphaeria archaeon]|nr:DUF99 family protein [Nitrososphaeria archaeon]
MRLSLEKRAIRVMGIAESFKKGYSQDALLAGVVMRSDFIVDGVVLGRCKVGGMDATDSILEMYRRLERSDISALILNGCIISWFNVIDLNKIYRELNLPLICLTYYPSSGIRDYFAKYFHEDWHKRIRVYEENGPRIEAINKNGFKIYLRVVGIDVETAIHLVNKYTLFGKVPEPLRLARLIAHAVFEHRYTSNKLSL